VPENLTYLESNAPMMKRSGRAISLLPSEV
jgi:hypothetical protein